MSKKKMLEAVNTASPVPLMIETAILPNVYNFLVELHTHFDKLVDEDREVHLDIKK